MKLYIVATPIGNLEDISFRAIRILNEVDLVLCEDTRVTKILLERYEIKKPILSYHQHSKLQKIDYIINLLKEGKNLALVSDAGTPGISDPGQRLIGKVLEELGGEIKIEPIPGPNAAIAALSISGFDTDEFLFLGFPPHKKGRQTFFVNILEESQKRTVVFYESTHRIIKALEQLDSLLQTKNYKLKTDLMVCRELTKKFETIYRGTPSEVLEKLRGGIIKGEFVVIIKSNIKN
ncbi:MAG: Ribosomal RNA small subunit methyltransferase I [Parcubacteria group bacterium GW2011_GWD2_38_12]|nr:MAG: Ribosomal RNA small subunit methyltransferase I [Parcubacteria group bacterium GW2011_GWC2_36_17]KKQ43756.1 MAG: Ribosomal RNA small subunit methyltransferase I [Parcubacteria group bacterium GW2011_GWE2_37_8]KKQ52158.1 MAG: Ribosomal RNA small subunit methyltransferase I [Parcubacteria group bacterium GW2011_GWD2_38_12]KKQ59549.1 MAG: Ribosomal RNA small subunit methyltransferase I [Parcubacteria group bacterium GW2011_GWD1_38_16]